MAELIAQWLGEALIYAATHLMAELMGRGAAEVFRRSQPVNPWLAVLGYLVWGVLMGLLSLVAHPVGFIAEPAWRLVNLVVTPVLVGWVMARWGSWLRHHDKTVMRLDTFFYGYLFALAMTWVRYAGVR